MNSTYRSMAMGILLATLLPVGAAHAQLGDLLKKGMSEGQSGGLGNLGGAGSMLSGQSLGAGNINNIAGVLEYCIKNNYLSGNGVSSVKDSLMGKLGGGSASSNSGFSDGARGILHSGDGKSLDLRGSGLKAAATKHVCDTVLSSAKSML